MHYYNKQTKNGADYEQIFLNREILQLYKIYIIINWYIRIICVPSNWLIRFFRPCIIRIWFWNPHRLGSQGHLRSIYLKCYQLNSSSGILSRIIIYYIFIDLLESFANYSIRVGVSKFTLLAFVSKLSKIAYAILV